jgi:ribose-phosphate pyrophosphokinase
MMSIDVHSPQTTELFRGETYDHLTATPEIRRAIVSSIGKEAVESCIVVAPDAGALKNNERQAVALGEAEGLHIDATFIPKERSKNNSKELKRVDKNSPMGKLMHEFVEGKVCLMFDDMIDSGGTIASAAEELKEYGAKEVYVGATHPILSGSAAEKLGRSAIDKVFLTDTLPINEDKREKMGDKLQVVPVGPLISRAIYESVVPNGSISKLFDDQNHQ